MTTSKARVDNPNELFTYETKAGDKVELLPFNRLPSKVFRKNRDADEMTMMFSIVEAATDEANLEIVDELPLEELGTLFEQWSESAGTELGKS